MTTRQSQFVLCVVAFGALAGIAQAQQVPLGAHHGGGATAGPTHTGAFSQSVPFALPLEGSGIPVPVGLHYDASSTVGEGGVGWRVPFSYVVRRSNLSRQRPRFATSWETPTPEERIVLVFGGGAIPLARPTASGRYYPIAGQQNLELEQVGPDLWTLQDGQGNEYRFEPIPALGDDSMWLLTEIIGSRGGARRVELDYSVASVDLPDGTSAPELTLDAVRYNFAAVSSCAKHEVRLDYVVDPTHELAVGESPRVLAYSVDGDAARARTRVLGAVRLLSYGDGCGSSQVELARYAMDYEPDEDTLLPRLRRVDVYGRAGTDEALVPVPVGRYDYGRASRGSEDEDVDEPTPPHVQFVDASDVPLPAATAAIGTMDGTSGTVGHYWTDSALFDVTGDGLPDFVFGSALTVARNLGGVDLSGPTASLFGGGPPLSSLGDQTTSARRYLYANSEMNTESTWTGYLDFNGDGRTDFIDARDPDRWKVHLNEPDPADPTTSVWDTVEVDIAPLRDTLAAAGYDVSGALPLSRSRTGQHIRDQICLEADYGDPTTTSDDQWVYCQGVPTTTVTVQGEFSIVEWKLADVNGDGYPDLVANRYPVDHRELEADEMSLEKCEAGVFGGAPPVDPWTGEPPDEPLIAYCYKELTVDHGYGRDNHLRVFYNRMGARVAKAVPFSPWYQLDGGVDCSVERWNVTHSLSGEPTGSSMGCGLVDVNGDGLVDQTRGANAYLGTGTSFGTHVKLPGSPAGRESGRHDTCGDDPSATPDAAYEVRQTRGFVEINGDGLPDYVSGGKVRFGTGLAWRDGIPIEGLGSVSLSTSIETCAGEGSRTTAGMFDIDGDGRADFVRAGTDEGKAATKLRVQKVSDPSGFIGAHSAGRIVRVHNGAGGHQEILYASAKADTMTSHQIPGREIVVAQTQVFAGGLGTSMAPVYYAYGDAALFFDAALDRWTFRGYGRHVAVEGMPAGTSGGVPVVNGLATITHSYRADELAVGYDRYALTGRPYDVYTLSGGLPANAQDLLAVDPASDPRWYGQTHSDWGTRYTDLTGATFNECTSYVDPYDFVGIVLEDGGTYDPHCDRRGFAYVASQTTRRGDSAPPSSDYVEARTTVVDIDDYARPVIIHHENDTTRADDDVCESVTYAEGIFGLHRLGFPSERTLYVGVPGSTDVEIAPMDCSGVKQVISVERVRYDGLLPGQVDRGLATRRERAVYDLETGMLVDDWATSTVKYDTWGNATDFESVREDGVSASVSLQDYDAFHLAPRTRVAIASDVAMPQISTTVLEPYSMAAADVTDPNGLTHRTLYDGLGRVQLETVVVPDDGQEYVVRAVEYLGAAVVHDDWDEQHPLGRHVRIRRFHERIPVASADLSSEEPGNGQSIATTYYDELGRPLRAERPLGADYGGDTIVVDDVVYDMMGRVRFAAAPYVASETPTDRFGTTYTYFADSTPWCEVTAYGLTPYSSGADDTSVADERYVQCYGRDYVDFEEVLTFHSPNATLAGAPQLGAYDRVVRSAIGWQLEHTRVQGTDTLERSQFGYDRLGNRTQTRRFEQPGVLAGIVEWRRSYDSLGRLRTVTEPESAVRYLSYDRAGNRVAVAWDELGATRRVQADFDGFGRVTREAEYVDGVLQPKTVSTFAYDSASPAPEHAGATYLAGRLAHAHNGAQDVYVSYDALGNQNRATRVGEEGLPYTVHRAYRLDGQPLELVFDLPDAFGTEESVQYAYDTAERMVAVDWIDDTGAATVLSAISIDPFGAYREIEYGNGARELFDVQEYGYRRPLVQRLEVPGGGSRYTSIAKYDGEGRILQQLDASNIGVERLDVSTYTYDAVDRLARARTVQFFSGDVVVDERYSHDGLGNLRSLTDLDGEDEFTTTVSTIDRDRICNLTHPSKTSAWLDQLSKRVRGGSTGSAACNYQYDVRGNTVSIADGATRTFAYDHHSRLVRANRGSSDLAMAYGPLGNIARVQTAGASVEDARDDHRYGPLVETSMFAADSTSTSVVERRIPGPRGIFMVRRGTGAGADVQYWHAGMQGAGAFTDAAGEVVQDQLYRPFGDVRDEVGTPNGKDYTRYQFDRGDNLRGFGIVQMGARAYDPNTGRFLQRDPLGIERTSTRSNPYAYAWNDPINRGDPSGLDPYIDCLDGMCPNTFYYFVAAGGFSALGAKAYDYLFGGGGGDAAQSAPVTPDADHSGLLEWTHRDPTVIEAFIANSEWAGRDLTEFEQELIEDGTHIKIMVGPDGYDPVGYVLGSSRVYFIYTRDGELIHSTEAGLETGFWYDPIDFLAGSGVARAGFYRLLGIGVKRAGKRAAGVVANSIDDVAKGAAKEVGSCFAAGTLVETSEGLVAIEEVVEGDLVWSREDSTGIEGWQPVVRTFVRDSPTLVDLDLLEADGDEQELLVTPSHPLWGENGWTSVADVEAGDLVWARDGWATVTGTEVLEGRHTVYNFEVAEFHTYFVGEGGVWAHNFCFNLRGKSLSWLKKKKPKGWKTVTSNNGKGWKWIDKSGRERFRYQRPSGKNASNSQWSHHENGYFRWNDEHGNFLDIDGNVVPKTDPDFAERTHIAYEGL